MNRLWRLACQCGYMQAKETIFISDGGSWCWDIHDRYFSDATGILDWYHASEHVWATARLVASDSPEAWAEKAPTVLHDAGCQSFVAWLKPQITQRRGGSREALETLTNYVSMRSHNMNYPGYRAANYQIGSGMIESTCKQLVGQRLKGPGMHWTEHGALAVTALRATDLNGKWKSFWNAIVLAG